MAAIRRAPKPPPKPRTPVKAPLHQRILGKAAVEVDTLADLRLELEKAYELDLIEYDSYLDCQEALDIRESKAKEAILKATGRYVKPEKRVDIKVRRVRHYRPKHYTLKVKIFWLICFLIFLKIVSFKP